jgi:hypothetical protein
MRSRREEKQHPHKSEQKEEETNLSTPTDPSVASGPPGWARNSEMGKKQQHISCALEKKHNNNHTIYAAI